MKCMVTSRASLIGSHVVDALIEDGHEVVVVDNMSTGRRENLNPRARFDEIDIRSPALAEGFERERLEAVNHHAAPISVRISLADPMYNAKVNLLGSLNLICLSLQYGVKKFIYSIRGAVYGELVYLPCDEDHPIPEVARFLSGLHDGCELHKACGWGKPPEAASSIHQVLYLCTSGRWIRNSLDRVVNDPLRHSLAPQVFTDCTS
ncbi:MAG: NAD-dependent epimerase/dehydratase family protein [Anaerolineae bacterium]|nr:NAD-dependent epimerase/dehydratase family protein [Thermoflexus sp.]MDW8065257.1 NAD-dependent epimerase/dehydratase family protein [Anaerolineae bacterium]